MEQPSEEPQGNLEPIAVIGLAIRFPGDAVAPGSFWRMIMEKKCCAKKIPENRMNIDAFHHPDPNRLDTTHITTGHFVEGDIAEFDASFFKLGAAEASAIDPQQRIGFETVYQALENAGLPMEKIIGSKTSVFSGAANRDYTLVIQSDSLVPAKYGILGMDSSLFANRISHFYDFEGPSLHVETACSSSLMALKLSCQSLWNGNAHLSVAASSNLILVPESVIAISNLGLLSPDGRCYSFDHRANGYGRGEGSAAIVTKRLTDAIRDGDTIRAVIRSAAANSDGNTPTITQPSMDSQEKLIRETYRKAGLDFDITRFVEAHGTGTAVGDPIESSAVGAVFGRYRSADDPLYLGSVKSNIGHLEGTSGFAGLVKSILALEKGIVPPNANFERLNPKIDAEYLNIVVPQTGVPWPSDGLRRASISSFGFGGSNCHVVIEDAYNHLRLNNLTGKHSTVEKPPLQDDIDRLCKSSLSLFYNSAAKLDGVSGFSSGSKDPDEGLAGGLETNGSTYPILQPRLLVWSSSDKEGISRIALSYSQYFHQLSLEQEKQSYLDNVAYTLGTRRSLLPWKSFVVADSLRNISLETSISKPRLSTPKPYLGFVFSGQGAQWHAMGRELLYYPVFKRSLQDASEYLRDIGCPWSLLNEYLKPGDESRVSEPEYSQGLCTALQIALVDLLASFGIFPSVVVGHSSGEIAAAYTAHFISRRSAWKLAYYRGVLASTLSRGAHTMMSVGLSALQLSPYFEKVAAKFDKLELVAACINSPTNTTVSGLEAQLDFLKSILDKDRIFVRKLHVSVAYHSPQMNVIAEDYLKAIQHLEFGEGGSSNPVMISSVTSCRVYAKDVIHSEYWKSNMISPVNFSSTISQICGRSHQKPNKLDGSHGKTITISEIIEIGPHSTLQGPIRDILKSIGRQADIGYISLLKRNTSAIASTLEALGCLHCSGYPLDLLSINNYSKDGNTSSELQVLVDLPSYPFKHSQKYWHESRTSRTGRRLRQHGRHDLLGTPVPDWNALNPMWRNIIKISELPWIEDHKINGRILYPGAGIVVMAIEAAKQIADPNRRVTGYNVRDVVFQAELNIPTSSDGIETRFYMTSIRGSPTKDEWFKFSLCSCNHDKWLENSHGYIQIDYSKTGSTGIGTLNEASEKTAYYTRIHQQGRAVCNIPATTDILYHNESEFDFGPAFHRLTNVACSGDGQAIGDVSLYSSSNHNTAYAQPHVIHPASFDGIFHSAILAFAHDPAIRVPAVVPTRIKTMWISNSGLNQLEADKVRVYVRSKPVGHRGTLNSMVAVDDTGQLRVFMEGQESLAISRNTENQDSLNSGVNLCFKLDWKPDLDFFGREQLAQYFGNYEIPNASRISFLDHLDILIQGFISRTLEAIDNHQLKGLKPHFQKYVDWMRLQVAETKLGPRQQEGAYHHTDIANKFEAFSAERNLVVAVGQSLSKILSGDIDPLDILYQGEQTTALHVNNTAMASFMPVIAKYMSTLAHKTPGMKILEIGTKIGPIAQDILPILSTEAASGELSTPRYSLYEYGGISEDALKEARATLSRFDRVKFKKLDIEMDPETQGFGLSTYDLIIAPSIHTAKSLNESLQNIRKLLSPHGKLILVEFTNSKCVRKAFTLGLLPDWWSCSEDYRQWAPYITEKKWNDVLIENGFSGVDSSVHDNAEEPYRELSMVISTAIMESEESLFAPEVMIVSNATSTTQASITRNLKCQLTAIGTLVHEAVSVQEAASTKPKAPFYIFILEVDTHLLRSLDEDAYDALHSILSTAKTVLWVTGNPEKYPEFGMVLGLGRVLTNENARLKFMTLSLEEPCANIEQNVRHILKVTKLISTSQSHNYEREFVERAGVLEIPRLIETPRLNHEVHSRVKSQQRKVQPFGSGPPLKLSIEALGLLDTLYFEEDGEHHRPIGVDEVEIKVHAVGVNFMDCLILLGRVNQKAIGAECAGVVSRVGGNSPFKPGDRVAACSLNTFRSYVRAPWHTVVKLPDTFSFAQAAAIPTNFTTAWHSLVEVGHIKEGETILIHAGSGGTGQAAIQIAQYFGAEIFATVGTAEKKKFLMDFYGLPEDHILYSRDASFSLGIKRLTKDVGVDLVLNSLSGELLEASWECIAPFGRFLEIGKKDIWSHGKLPMFPFAKNVTFSAIDLASMSTEAHLHLVRNSFTAVMELIGAGKLHGAHPLQVFKMSRIEDAFRSMQTGKNYGKMVVEIGADDPVLTILDTKPTYTFKQDATYIISGGLGGVGRVITRWMVNRGAKHLMLLSRSGIRTDPAKALVEELQGEGVVVATPACDITDASILRDTLETCMKNMPPIRGCIQASMVLEDSTFENMTFEKWDKAIRPKVHGSWNLHRHLPPDLDFFIMLSSISGICGSRGQSNYAAGNTYQDLLAYHRVANGQKAVSIDLGIIISAGVIKENKELMERHRTSALTKPVTMEELLALLDRFCNPESELLTSTQCQVVTGLTVSGSIHDDDPDRIYWMESPIFSQIKHMDDMHHIKNTIKGSADYVAQFASASSLAEASAIVSTALAAKLSRVLAIPVEDLDFNKPIKDFGADSLVAVELRNWFSRDWGTEVAVFDIIGGATITVTGGLVASRSPHRQATWTE
ncbi:hypothetical protein EMPG_17105 [Blastomyces silverae]|uniref:Non-reducing polyketide synthase nscA n=1 Tax=Blastomyces silverae TaxID=2060906 RepID=A0A0H1B8T3_9EURO|nr:hypothetical protein EMPG_17105 [Blastomyces silverae]